MRLVDAHLVQEIADREIGGETASLIQYVLSHTPTADAEPVRHGGWEHIHEGVYHKVRCTACGVDAIIANTYIYDTRGLLVKWAYCPNCGAKMDGDDDATN